MKVEEGTCTSEIKTRAQRLYEKYIENSDGKSWDGRPCPPWVMLSPAVRSHWCAVSIEVERELRAAVAAVTP